MSKTTPILLTTRTLSGIIGAILDEDAKARAAGRALSKSQALNIAAAAIAGDKHDWGFLTGRDGLVVARDSQRFAELTPAAKEAADPTSTPRFVAAMQACVDELHSIHSAYGGRDNARDHSFAIRSAEAALKEIAGEKPKIPAHHVAGWRYDLAASFISDQAFDTADMSLKDIAYHTDEGDAIGGPRVLKATPLTRAQLNAHARDYGSDESFFAGDHTVDYIVEVSCLVNFDDLDEEDTDADGNCAVDGSYRIGISFEDEDLARSEDYVIQRVLDIFHEHVAIACLDDFTVLCRPAGPNDSGERRLGTFGLEDADRHGQHGAYGDEGLEEPHRPIIGYQLRGPDGSIPYGRGEDEIFAGIETIGQEQWAASNDFPDQGPFSLYGVREGEIVSPKLVSKPHRPFLLPGQIAPVHRFGRDVIGWQVVRMLAGLQKLYWMSRPANMVMSHAEAAAELDLADARHPQDRWIIMPVLEGEIENPIRLDGSALTENPSNRTQAGKGKVRRSPPVRGAVQTDRLIGWQVENDNGDCWGDRASFEILSRERAEADYAEAEDAGRGADYVLVPIHEGDIESPCFID